MEAHRRLTWRYALVCLSGLMALAPQMKAQEVEGVGIGGSAVTASRVGRARSRSASLSGPDTWGTQDPTTHTIQAFAFMPITDTMAYSGSGLEGALICSGVTCAFEAPVLLPAGALVSEIELEACDTDPANNAAMWLYRGSSPGGGATLVEFLQSSGTPGCDFFASLVLPPEPIDNFNNRYFIQVSMGPTSATKFFAVRLFYRLQVSPAPAVATFTDVPTGHPYFRFVEALVNSGITAGCGGGQFCVNNPITRGEMAVFLAAALGLHFAP